MKPKKENMNNALVIKEKCLLIRRQWQENAMFKYERQKNFEAKYRTFPNAFKIKKKKTSTDFSFFY